MILAVFSSVDDIPTNQRIFTSFLQRLGYPSADVAEDGAAALQWLLERARRGISTSPVVLLDMHMPVLNGVQTLSTWRLLEAQLGVPRAYIIVISATDHADIIGADAFIGKPVMLGDLSRILLNRHN